MQNPLNFFCTLLLLLICNSALAQNWIWASGAIGDGTEECYSIASDASGNVYVAGEFLGNSISFGPFTLNNINSQKYDLCLAKYNSLGEIQWAKRFGGKSHEYMNCVATDALGNVYITGAFESDTIAFGIDTFIKPGLYDDMFIVKFDHDGNEIWALKAEEMNNSINGYSVKSDVSSNVYATGTFTGPTLILGLDTLLNYGGTSVFIVKYDSSGNELWAKNTKGVGSGYPYDIATNSKGDVFLTGYYLSDSLTFYPFTIYNAGSYDYFLVKYDSSGEVSWAKSGGGIQDDGSYNVAADNDGNAYITGFFKSSTIILGGDTLYNQGFYDYFIANYANSGNILWAKSAGGEGQDEGYAVEIDTKGNVYVLGGFFSSSIILGTDTFSFPPVYNGDPMFLVEYDPSGNQLCSAALASGGDDANSISIDQSDNIFVGGDFEIDPFFLGSNILTLTGGENIFVAKFSCGIDAVPEINNSNKLILSPNPFTTQLQIQYTISQPGELMVYDALGRKVKSCLLPSNQKTFELSLVELPAGVYLVAVNNGGQFFVEKVVKE